MQHESRKPYLFPRKKNIRHIMKGDNMREAENLVGRRYGKLVIIERDYKEYNTSRNYVRWICQCDCGKVTSIVGDELKREKGTRSCGCGKIEASHKRKRLYTETPLYDVWYEMIRRCENPKDSSYKNYGGRGIKVCSEWHEHEGFLRFREWAYQNGYTESLTIDRIDVNGNYEPSNCRWLTRKQQCNNKRNTVFLTYKGVTRSISEWSDFLNLPYGAIGHRYNRGWDIERIFTQPFRVYENGSWSLREIKI